MVVAATMCRGYSPSDSWRTDTWGVVAGWYKPGLVPGSSRLPENFSRDRWEEEAPFPKWTTTGTTQVSSADPKQLPRPTGP